MDLVVAAAEDITGRPDEEPLLIVSIFVNGISPRNRTSSSPEGSTNPNST